MPQDGSGIRSGRSALGGIFRIFAAGNFGRAFVLMRAAG